VDDDVELLIAGLYWISTIEITVAAALP